MKSIITLCLIVTFILALNITQAYSIKLANNVSFLGADISSWKERVFKGHTEYKLIKKDEIFILQAHCNATASAFYNKTKVDLTKTPILNWSWKIDNIHKGLDDVSKDGDDFSARIYVIHKGLIPWNVKALNYVWANKKPKGSHWSNAFTKKAAMIAQQSGTPINSNIWQKESRNIRDDFKKHFNLKAKEINGIAIMTDCDNGGGKATSYYRDIYFTSVEQNQE